MIRIVQWEGCGYVSGDVGAEFGSSLKVQLWMNCFYMSQGVLFKTQRDAGKVTRVKLTCIVLINTRW